MSLFFYSWWNPAYFFLIALSLTTNYTLGRLILTNIKKHNKFLFLILGITFNLGLLSYYKYSSLIVDIINDITSGDISLGNVILPLAISFFTFQQIAFLVDSTYEKIKSINFPDYVLFVSFFPQLIAGPIVHYKEMIPQFSSLNTTETSKNLTIGITLFSIGLFKKVVFADSISDYVSPIYDQAATGNITFLQAWIAGVGFTLQIYFDFSGYSDMALGIARMFGIILPINFNSPLKATSIIDFWSRWHITLTRFLRDYLYIPLGGNRRGTPRKFFNILVTMFISGLWHGAGYQYLMWGSLHGFFILLNHSWYILLPNKLYKSKCYQKASKPIGVILTLFMVSFSFLFFRAEDLTTGYRMASSMIGINGFSLPEGIYIKLDFLNQYLKLLNITVDATSGSQIVYGSLLTISLLFIALVFPNSLDIMKNFKPALGYLETKKGVVNLLYYNKLKSLIIFKHSKLWAVIVGTSLAIGIMGIQQVSEFIYWQF